MRKLAWSNAKGNLQARAIKDAGGWRLTELTLELTQVKKMLPLMDQDKDGKVSKQDFMNFMEAEFDRLDKKKEGKLEVKKLTQPPAQPVRGFHK
jgi:hypothetical protein